MKQTIRTDKIIKIAKHFADQSKEYKGAGKTDLSNHYKTLALGIESALKVLALEDNEEITKLGYDMIHKAIWDE